MGEKPEPKHPLSPVLDAIVEALSTINGVLQDINSTLAAQRTERGTAPRPSESAVSGGARTTEQPSMMQELTPYEEYLRFDSGKFFVAKFIPKGDRFKEVNNVFRKYGYEYESCEDWKDSHWRKKR